MFKLQKLDNENYSTWFYQIKQLLDKEEVWEVIKGTAPKEKDKIIQAIAEWKKKQRKALNIIGLSVVPSQTIYIRHASTGTEAWNSFKEHHQLPTLAAKIRIMKSLFKSEIQAGESMRAHLSRIFSSFDELAEMEYNLDDTVKIGIVLASVDIQYGNLVTAMEAWTEDRLILASLKRKLI